MSARWHSFTFYNGAEELSLSVDGEEASRSPVTTTLDKVFIRGGMVPDRPTADASKAYWDSILVTAYKADASLSLEEEEAVVYDFEMHWSLLSTTGPPARQAHTAVTYEDGMYVFGGERSAYEYGDLWRFSFADSTWEFQASVNSSASLARHDHSAVVYDGTMYVYGGRNPSPVGDMWAYSFAEKTWTEVETPDDMPARFGHAAVVVGESMYVYGGYVHETAALTSDIWSFEFSSGVWTKVGPRLDNFMQGSGRRSVADPSDAIIFPMDLPPERFSTVAVASGSALYVAGGAGGDSMMEELEDVWRFDTEKKMWSVPADGYRETGLKRYDASGATIGDGSFLVLFGGHGGGEHFGDTYAIFIGEQGL